MAGLDQLTTNVTNVGGNLPSTATPGMTDYNQIVNPILNNPNLTNAQRASQLTATGLSPDQISTASGLSPLQLQNTYGYTAPTPAAIPNEIAQNYQNLFGRAPDTGGAQYWTGTGLTGDALRNAMIAGAIGSDIQAYQKLSAAPPPTTQFAQPEKVYGTAGFTAQQVRDYIEANKDNNLQGIVDAANQYGISAEDIKQATGYTGQDMAQFMANKNALTDTDEFTDYGNKKLTEKKQTEAGGLAEKYLGRDLTSDDWAYISANYKGNNLGATIKNLSEMEQTKKLYNDILHRDPTPEELAAAMKSSNWKNIGTNLQTTLGSSVIDPTTSDITKIIEDQYATIGRTGIGTESNQIDQAGLDYWTNELKKGNITLNDFKKNFGDAAEEDFIRSSYKDMFGHDPDAEGLQYWKDTLNSTNKDEIYKSIAAGAQGADILGASAYQNNGVVTTDAVNKFISETPSLLDQYEQFKKYGISDLTKYGLKSDYFDSVGDLYTDYTNNVIDSVFGEGTSDSFDATTREQFATALVNGDITREGLRTQLANSDYNKKQEAITMAGTFEQLYGLTHDDATALAARLAGITYNGPGTVTDDIFNQAKSYYDRNLLNQDSANEDILKDAANRDGAENTAYFKAHPDLLTVYKNVGDTVKTTHAGAGGQYGYYNGKPILKASELDLLFDRMGTDLILGDSAGSSDNSIGWDTGSTSGRIARGAAIFGITKNQQTDEYGNTYDNGGYSGDLQGVAKKLGIDTSKFKDTYKTIQVQDPDTGAMVNQQVIDRSADDQLYDAINEASKDLVYVVGKTGKGASWNGATDKNGVTTNSSFQNAPTNHAAQMYRKVGDKYIPVGDANYFNADMELSHGWFADTFGGLADIPFLPEIIGIVTENPALYASLKGAQTAAHGGSFGDVLKSGAFAYAGAEYLPQISQAAGQQIGSVLGITDPAIMNIIGRGAVNLGVGTLTGQNPTNALVNTGLNLGLNATGLPNNFGTQLASSLALPALTGNLNSNVITGALTRAGMNNIRRNNSTTTMKEGGLAYMKSGGKVKGGLPHFEDGGWADFGLDTSSWDFGGSTDFSTPSDWSFSPSTDFGLDTSSWDFGNPLDFNFDSGSTSSWDFGTPSTDFGLDTSSWDFNTPTTDFNLTDTIGTSYPDINITEPDISSSFTSPLSQTQIDEANKTLSGLDTGNDVWDQKEPQVVEYTAEQYQNEDINDPLGRNSVIVRGPAGEVVGVIDADGKVVQGDLEVRSSENPRTGQIEYQYVDKEGRVVGGFDENGSWFNGNLTQSTAGSTDVVTGDPGKYAGSNESLGGTPVTNFGGNLPNVNDVNKLLNYNSGLNDSGLTKVIHDTLTKIIGGGNTPTTTAKTGAQQKAAPDAGGLTNLVGSVTRSNPSFTLSGAPTYQSTVNPMYKAVGGRINLPQFQALNNYIDHNFDSNYASPMAKGGQPQGGGLNHVPEFYSEGGLKHRYVKGRGDGTSDEVPAMLANGEFVIPADVVSGLGNGSNDSGAKILDEFLKVIRRDKRAASPDKLPADSKGPQAYLLQAKRKVRK